MRTLKLLSIFAILIAISVSCSDKIENTPDTGDELLITNFNISPDFKWETAKDYTFRVNGGVTNETVKITSIDGSVTYHKGTYIEDGGGYTVKLRIPTFVYSVKVNDVEYNLAGSDVNVNLSTKASLTNYALSFDGVNDYVDLGDMAELNNAAAFTIEGWARQASNTDTEIIYGTSADANNDIVVKTDGGALEIHLGNGSDSYATWALYSGVITSGIWFHWAVVYDGAGGSNADRLKLFINGNTTPITLAFTGTIPATTSSSLTGNGSSLSSTSDFFGGYMDEFRVWDDVRTPSEINTYYNAKITDPSSEANLVAYYGMDEGTGTTLGDEQENYDATINGPTWVLFANGWDSDGDTVSDINDDYWDDPLRAHDNYYPAADTGTVVFEDLWPGFGDYDCNDLVMGYQFKTVTSATNTVTEVYAFFELRAHGAQLNNGFGFQLDNANAGLMSDLTVTGYSSTGSAVTLGAKGLESGQAKPVVIVMDQIKELMDNFVNVGEGSWSATASPVPLTIEMTVPGGTYTASDFDLANWNPFIFVDQVRGHEIHLLDYAPTDLVNNSLFGTMQDSSVVANNKYYLSKDLLPWALEFPTSFEYPFEKKEVSRAYLHFQEWAESGGVDYTDWYSNTAAGYRDTQWIYVPTP